MNIDRFKCIIDTVWHLRFKQLFYQIKNRLITPGFKLVSAPESERTAFLHDPIEKLESFYPGYFIFLNKKSEFKSWDDISNGNLWCYNLNYMDWLGQEGMTEEDGGKWIDSFISSINKNKIGLDPYPMALRSINWVKFFSRFPESATIEREEVLYSQLFLLEKKLEYHLLGNHLLEDAFSLYIGAAYFNNKKLLKRAERLLEKELKEQVLPDGAHFEQSPMYHCILLDRLLDCINICPADYLISTACRMLGHLDSIVWKDGTIPLLNDSANGIAPSPGQLFTYAGQLGLKWKPIPMKECGYRRFSSDHFEAIVDVGNITASYQPGHSHADTFNYELRIDGTPFIVDTGISTYEKNTRRQYERGTSAHNTVTVEDKDSSEVWGGFRVGRRASVKIEGEGERWVTASHDGFGKRCKRSFALDSYGFSVEDSFSGAAISRIHISHDCSLQKTEVGYIVNTPIARLVIENAIDVILEKANASVEYNRFYEVTVAVISFNNVVKYFIYKNE
ncbi:MAG: alginate lyase family protein [Bacteroidales bacterium]|nr:alginate lyase family protein [Bacteroidales bacterium]